MWLVVSKKVPGSNPPDARGYSVCSLHVLSRVCVGSRWCHLSCILPQFRHMPLEDEWPWWMRVQMVIDSIGWSEVLGTLPCFLSSPWVLRIQKGFPHFPLKIRFFVSPLANVWVFSFFFFFYVANSHIPRIRNTIPSLSFIVDTNQQTSPYLQWERNNLILKAGTYKQRGTQWVPRTAILLFFQQKAMRLTPNETESFGWEWLTLAKAAPLSPNCQLQQKIKWAGLMK